MPCYARFGFCQLENRRTRKKQFYDTHLYKLCDEAGIKRFCMQRHWGNLYPPPPIERPPSQTAPPLFNHTKNKTSHVSFFHETIESGGQPISTGYAANFKKKGVKRAYKKFKERRKAL